MTDEEASMRGDYACAASHPLPNWTNFHSLDSLSKKQRSRFLKWYCEHELSIEPIVKTKDGVFKTTVFIGTGSCTTGVSVDVEWRRDEYLRDRFGNEALCARYIMNTSCGQREISDARRTYFTGLRSGVIGAYNDYKADMYCLKKYGVEARNVYRLAFVRDCADVIERLIAEGTDYDWTKERCKNKLLEIDNLMRFVTSPDCAIKKEMVRAKRLAKGLSRATFERKRLALHMAHKRGRKEDSIAWMFASGKEAFK